MEPDDPSAPSTRLGFLTNLTRRAAQARPAKAPGFEAAELPPPGTPIEPALSDDAFLADVDAAREAHGMHIWWLGQSGFLVQIDGDHILLDPYLSDSSGAERSTRRVVAPERLAFVDAVASSAGQIDRLDPGTLQHVLARKAKLVCAAGSEAVAEERAGRPPDAALAPGDDVTIGHFRIDAVPAYSARAPEAVGYVVRNGPYALYHAGDTRRVQGMAEAVAPYAVDVAFLPVTGNGVMGGADAARLAQQANVRIAVPCHIQMFRHATASPSRFVAECARIGQEWRLPAAGERLTLEP